MTKKLLKIVGVFLGLALFSAQSFAVTGSSTDFQLDFGEITSNMAPLSSTDFAFQSGWVGIGTNGESDNFQFATKHYIPAICGNGVVEGNEECDDGNTINGDGCSASCTTEVTDTSSSPSGGGYISGSAPWEVQHAKAAAPEAPAEVITPTPTEPAKVPTEVVAPTPEAPEAQPTIIGSLRPSAPELVVPDIDFALPTIPEQLFDISLEIDNPRVTDIGELTARANLFNFGTEPTPIDLKFIIKNEFGKNVYTKSDHLVVQTEAVASNRFEDLNLPVGKYTLFLETLYGDGVFDQFAQPFEIIEKESLLDLYSRLPLRLWIIFIILAAIGAVTVLYCLKKFFTFLNSHIKLPQVQRMGVLVLVSIGAGTVLYYLLEFIVFLITLF